jgi:outer membrane receptor for ferrienterochelin and colicin
MLGLYTEKSAILPSLFRRTFCGSALIAACATMGTAFAATPPIRDDLALEEVVVSATRVGEKSLQTTPMAISVISPEELDSKGLSGVSDFMRSLPSVNMQSISPGENDIEMRGLVCGYVFTENKGIRVLSWSRSCG